MLCISAAYAVVRCLSVRLSVRSFITFMYSIKTSNHILKLFSLSGSHTILVFPHQTLWLFRQGRILMGASNAAVVLKKSRFLQIFRF